MIRLALIALVWLAISIVVGMVWGRIARRGTRHLDERRPYREGPI